MASVGTMVRDHMYDASMARCWNYAAPPSGGGGVFESKECLEASRQIRKPYRNPCAPRKCGDARIGPDAM